MWFAMKNGWSVPYSIQVCIEASGIRAGQARPRTSTFPRISSSGFPISRPWPRSPRRCARIPSRGEAGSAGVVEVEDSAHQLSRGIEARYGIAVGGDHLRVGVDAQAAEGEGDPAGHRVGFEGRRVDGVRPVRLVQREPPRAAAVLEVGVEWNVR